jgi:hypothetical protein
MLPSKESPKHLPCMATSDELALWHVYEARPHDQPL